MRPLPISVLCLLASALSAQTRNPIAGSVRNGDGTPAAGAAILFTATSPEGEAFRPTDVVRAVADERGRFHVRLLAGRDYSGSATAAVAGADGVRLGSPVLEDLAPGAPADFVLSEPRRPRTVVVAHADAWLAAGCPLQLRLGPQARNFAAAAVPVGHDGRVELPALPISPLHAQVLDAAGEVLWQAPVPAEATTVPLPPPQALPVRVLDGQGRPLANVALRAQVEPFQPPPFALAAWPFRREYRAAATTAENGFATVLVARAISPLVRPEQPQLLLVAHREGFAEGYAGFDGERFEDARHGILPDRLTIVLEPAQPVTGLVLGVDGAPIADAPVFVNGTIGVTLGDMVGTFDRTWRARTGRDGRFTLGAVPPAAQLSHVVVGEPPGAAGPLVPPTLHPLQLGAVRELTIDARQHRPCRVQVLDASGGPAANAVLRLQPIANDPTGYHQGHVLRLDAAGRAAFRLPPGKWLLAAADATGYVEQVLDEDPPTEPLALLLEPLPKARLQVLGPSGKPAPGARASLTMLGSSGNGSPLHEARQAVRFWLDPVLLERARGGPDGSLVLPFVPHEPGAIVQVSVTAPGLGAEPIELGEAAEPRIVRLPAAK